MINWVALSVFIFFFLVVTVLGFFAARWRRGDLNLLSEWGLAGRRFGTIVTWFLLGGDLYTAYTFVAVPGLIYASGAIGFYAVPYTILVYPIIYLLMPKFWSVCKQHGYVTAADFVRGRFGSGTLALLIAITGIVATLPYIALQMFGIAVSIAQMGVNVEAALIVAFFILAAYTYTSGLRAPAMIALVKDTMIFIVLFAALIIIPIRLGGFGHIFAAVHAKAVASKAAVAAATAAHRTPPAVFTDILSPAQYLPYTTLALGSALALFLYPHSLTGTLSSNSRGVVKRNTALLPIYSLMLGLLALLGYMAIAAHIKATGPYKANGIVPALLEQEFPDWFAGFALAAISIGALVPAAIMSIAAANLFTRNIYKEYLRPTCSDKEEANCAKISSLIIKLGALLFILLIPATNIINFQLLGGIIIIQTLPSVFLGLYTNWLHRIALIVGWVVGMATGIWMFITTIPGTAYTVVLGGQKFSMYEALVSVVLNVVVAAALTLIFRAAHMVAGRDVTRPADYEETYPESAESLPGALG